MRKRKTPLLSSRPKNQIRDYVDDEKSLGKATKSQIASAIGIRPSHFSNLLNGRNEWKLNQLEKLAAFLDVPLARLFEERNPDPETGSSEEGGDSLLEDRLVRAIRTESRYLRGGLRADLGAMLREHLAGRPPDRADDDAANVAPSVYPDTPIDIPGALPIEIRDPDTLYDGPPEGSASESLWFKRDWLSSHGLDPAKCLIVRVQGESMGNTLPDGCSALVDLGRRERREGRIYALRTERGLAVGRAAKDSAGGWLLESDHPEREALAWPEDAEIIGEVRWMARSF